MELDRFHWQWLEWFVTHQGIFTHVNLVFNVGIGLVTYWRIIVISCDSFIYKTKHENQVQILPPCDRLGIVVLGFIA